jgi:hypothetical protein
VEHPTKRLHAIPAVLRPDCICDVHVLEFADVLVAEQAQDVWYDRDTVLTLTLTVMNGDKQVLKA